MNYSRRYELLNFFIVRALRVELSSRYVSDWLLLFSIIAWVIQREFNQAIDC